jgi:hypothetical protein
MAEMTGGNEGFDQVNYKHLLQSRQLPNIILLAKALECIKKLFRQKHFIL